MKNTRNVVVLYTDIMYAVIRYGRNKESHKIKEEIIYVV